MMNYLRLLLLFGLPLITAPASQAADMGAPATVVCLIDRTESLLDLGGPKGASKAAAAKTRLSHWVFQGEQDLKRLPIQFFWEPRSDRGPTLRIMLNGEDRRRATLLSRTKDSLSSVLNWSDRFTTRTWLFTLNFHQELVMATKVESNIGGMKAKVFTYACDYQDTSPAAPGDGSSTG